MYTMGRGHSLSTATVEQRFVVLDVGKREETHKGLQFAQKYERESSGGLQEMGFS